MEDRRHHRSEVAGIIVAVSLALIAAGSPSATAKGDTDPFDWPTTVTVETDPDAVNIDVDANGETPGASGTGTQGSGGGPRCYLKEVPGPDMTDDLTWQYWARRMRYAPYYTICDGVIKGIVWIELQPNNPAGPGAAGANPRDIAMEIRDRMPIPQVTVEINPDRGLVGAESWFWIQGYDGRPLTRSTDAFGASIDVQATVTRYDWEFGDGGSFSGSSLGEAYPRRSEVRHTYQRSSDGNTAGYPIDVTFVFSVRYRVATGAWIDLPGISRIAHGDYPVRESQAVIQR